MTMYTLKDITRPSGGFAMLAVDQREAMRLMFAAADDHRIHREFSGRP